MSTATLTTSVEKIQPTAIIKLDGPLNDFHAKELIGIIDDLLPQNFVHFIINFDKCIEVNNYGVSVLISLISSINAKQGKLIFTKVDAHLEKKLKMMSTIGMRASFGLSCLEFVKDFPDMMPSKFF